MATPEYRMNLPQLIGINAPAKQSGKSTVADLLVLSYHYKPFKMAGGIYAMFSALCDYVGMDAESKYHAVTTQKEVPQSMLAGASFRTFAEGPGHYCRTALGRDFWRDIAHEALAERLDRGHYIVVDDVRMDNEAEMLRSLGGKIVKVVRPTWNGGFKPALPSELDSPVTDANIDIIIANDSSVEGLKGQVRRWLCSLDARQMGFGWTGSQAS